MPPKRRRTTRANLKSVEQPKKQPAKQARTSPSKSSKSTKQYLTPRQAKYPPWSTLPLIPLSRVLELACADDTSRGGRNASWLLGASTVCKNFCDPALTLLYENPPCKQLKKFNQLVSTVRDNPELGAKIRKLVPSGALSLSPKFVDLVKYTPNLKDFIFDGDVDGYFNTATVSYPATLFSTMKETGIKLRSWTWNGLIAYKLNDPPMIKHRSENYVNRSPGFLTEYHLNDSFLALRSLKLRYFIMVYPDELEDREEKDEELAAKAIESLAYLEDLTIERCDFCSNRFLGLMKAQKFRSLTLDNCANVDAEGLSLYLKRQGSRLRSLAVRSCANMSLEFASELDTSTPELSFFEYDPRHFNPTEKGLDTILPLTAAVPAWPKSLMSLNLRHMMPWSSMECVRLLQTLLDGAESGSLGNVRDLHVWCIVQDLSWRDRSELRQKWTPAIFEAFLDHSKDEYKAFRAKLKSMGGKDAIAYSGSSNVAQRITFRIDNSRPGAQDLDEDDFLDTGGPVLSRRRTFKTPVKSRAKVRAAPKRSRAATNDDDDAEDEDFSASEPSYGSQSSDSE